MFQPSHVGLYLAPAAIQRVSEQRQRKPYAQAWAALDALQPDDPLAAALVAGLRYRLTSEQAAGEQAITALTGMGGIPHSAEASYAERCAQQLAIGQVFELVRDQLTPEQAQTRLLAFTKDVNDLLAFEGDTLFDQVWHTALQIGGAVVLEAPQMFASGVSAFKAIIDAEIHPEGHMPKLVEHKDGSGLFRTLLAAKALTLAAEAASHVGENLWEYAPRGISVKTAAIYAVAYYEHHERWQWDTLPPTDEIEALYQAHGGFIEMLNPHLRPEVLRETLKKLRPIFDPTGGGLTTLTHAPVESRGWLSFGR